MTFTILVAGGGVGGLSFAKAVLVRARELGFHNDIKVHVLERSASQPSTGHGLTLFEGLGVLHRLGLDGGVLDSISSVLNKQVVTADGRIIIDNQVPKQDEFSPRGIRRPDLVRALCRSLPNDTISFDWEIVQICHDDKKVKIMNQKGQELIGDVLVGFDGIKSRVRARIAQSYANGQVSSTHEANEFAKCCVLLGTADLGGLAPTDVDDDMIQPVGMLVHHFDRQTGAVGVYSTIGNNSVAWTIGYRCPHEPPRNADWKDNDKALAAAGNLLYQWKQSSSLNENDVAVIDFQSLLSHSKGCMQLGVYAQARSYKSQPWFYGRLVVGGDAAHAVLPLLGEGANLAICDAAVLARHLLHSFAITREVKNQSSLSSKSPTMAEITAAFRLYEVERRPPSESGVTMTRWLRPVMLCQNALLCNIRNLFMRHLLIASWTDAHLRGNDAVELLNVPVQSRNPHANIGSNIAMVLAHLAVLGTIILIGYHQVFTED